MAAFLEVWGILFLAVVAPIWIISHYLSKNRASKRLSPENESRLAELWESAQAMESRIHTLERILDESSPGWRGRT